MYSASVAGMSPHPLHSKRPSQSPVAQWPSPSPVKWQPVRPQIRPFQPWDTSKEPPAPAGTVQPVCPEVDPGLGGHPDVHRHAVDEVDRVRAGPRGRCGGRGSEERGGEDGGDQGEPSHRAAGASPERWCCRPRPRRGPSPPPPARASLLGASSMLMLRPSCSGADSITAIPPRSSKSLPQEIATALRMGLLAAAEHDRDFDLVAVLEEALDVAFLGVVVVRPRSSAAA